jgi:signal transduction histidine kinase
MHISTKIFVAFGIILLVYSLTTVVNWKQAQAIKENSEWVANSQKVIRYSSRLQRNLVDMESDLRGFLLYKNKNFISSFDSLSSENDSLFSDLHLLITSSFQAKKLDSIRWMHQKWEKEIARPLLNIPNLNAKDQRETYSWLEKNEGEKQIRLMIMNHFRDFNDYEYDLREKKRAQLATSVTKTSEFSIALTIISIVIGFAVAIYVVRIISKRIFEMVNMANGIADGNFDIEINDRSNDELTNLSKSLTIMAHRLKENIIELESKNKELDQFAYVVSHDLKAPLRGIENITMWIQEDLEDELSPKMIEYIQLLVGRIKRMENLIQGILDLSKVGRTKQRVENVDVKELVNEVIEMLSPPPQLKVSVQPQMPVFKTERILLQQVFSNLISNSIKYHDKKNGRIEVGCKDYGDHYLFNVKDDGSGIAPRYHEKIFQVFQTLKERDAFESTGVGLAIVKKILSEKKSSINVFSEEGKGANFVFTWPKS